MAMLSVLSISNAVSGPHRCAAYGVRMILAEEVLVLLTHEVTGRPVVPAARRDLAVAGAVVAELALAGRLVAAESGVFARVALRVVDTTPCGDDVLDAALARAGSGGAAPTAVLGRIRGGLTARLLERLAARGVLRREQGRVLGLFPTSVWPVADADPGSALRRRLHDVLVGGQPPTPREASLVAILSALDVVPTVLPGTGVAARALKARARQVAAGDVGADAVRRTIAATQAAMTAAMLSTTAATST